MRIKSKALVIVLAMALVGIGGDFSTAAESKPYKLKVAVAIKGLLTTSIPIIIADKLGFFADENIELDKVINTRGGAENVQIISAGQADVNVFTGILGAMGAFKKGANIRVIALESTFGAPEVFFYAKGDAPFNSFEEIPDSTKIAFSRPGSSTNLMTLSALEALKKQGKNVEAVSTGGLPDTYTAVKTGQVDIGWAVPPFFLDKVAAGELKVIYVGNDIPGIKELTLRASMANSDWLKKNPEVARGFLRALRRAIDFMYDNPNTAIGFQADFNAKLGRKLPLASFEKGFQFYPKKHFQFSPVQGLDRLNELVVEFGFAKEKLSKAQLDELFQFQYQP